MRNTNKKGFTIVELVVVVAVIAILAAVLIPTFSGVIRKANIAKDNQLIKHLNTALAADVDNDHTMPTDAFNAAAEYGYDIAKIDAKANGNKILWDSVNDVFCYYNSDNDKIEYLNAPAKKDVADADYWVISNEVNNVYSTYLYGCTATAVEAKYGLDAGNCAVNVLYQGSGNVKIRTNGGTLTVNNDAAVVAHYGDVYLADIQAVAASSYHEFGSAQSMIVKKGRVVVENTGSVKILDVSAADAGVKIEAAASATVKNVVANADATKVTFTGSAVADTSKHIDKTEVATMDALKAAIASGAKYIVLTADITTTEDLKITQSLILDGNGKTLTNDKNDKARGIHIGSDDIDYVDVTIKNLTINVPNATNARGINLWSEAGAIKKADLNIENCTINVNASASVSESYGINVPEDVCANINVIGSNITAWGVLNVIGEPGTKIVVNGGALTGVNKKNGTNGNFGVIVAEGHGSEEDNDSIMISSTLDIQISNAKIVAKAEGDSKQAFVRFNRASTLNNISLTNCEFVAEGTKAGGYENYGVDNICTVDGETVKFAK